jgi:outer membrane receptor for ferrienterochelin and colicin
MNLTFQVRNLWNNQLTLNCGVYNLLNQTQLIGYAYKAGYQPMVSMGREFFIQCKLNL